MWTFVVCFVVAAVLTAGGFHLVGISNGEGDGGFGTAVIAYLCFIVAIVFVVGGGLYWWLS